MNQRDLNTLGRTLGIIIGLQLVQLYLTVRLR
jgi:hypothetical protein